MTITVIYGTEKHGITYRLTQLFLDCFGDDVTIHRFFLPRDCPAFCSGCCSCFFKGEAFCKDAVSVQNLRDKILAADLLVLASPVYVFHATAAMKNMLDHLAFQWMVHRPAAAMFSKRAVIITQSVGAGQRSAVKDMRDSLSWWGISQIGVFKMPLMEDIFWEKISEKRRKLLEKNIQNLGMRTKKICAEKASPSLITRIKFSICRIMQKSVYQKSPDSFDAAYWKSQGWLDQKRPWKP